MGDDAPAQPGAFEDPDGPGLKNWRTRGSWLASMLALFLFPGSWRRITAEPYPRSIELGNYGVLVRASWRALKPVGAGAMHLSGTPHCRSPPDSFRPINAVSGQELDDTHVRHLADMVNAITI